MHRLVVESRLAVAVAGMSELFDGSFLFPQKNVTW
jgi:hypothetical protein